MTLSLPPPAAPVVAEMLVLDGFALDPVSDDVLILENGDVIALVGYRDGHKTQVSIAHLQDGALKKLKTAVADFPTGQLVKQDPDGTPCEDGPSSTYNLHNAKGEVVGFAKVDSCLEYVREDHRDASWLRSLLDGLRAVQPD